MKKTAKKKSARRIRATKARTLGPATTAHLGSPVIMMRYEAPELIGQKRAAIIVDGPFTIAEGPHTGEEGADLMWLVNEIGISDPENGDPVYVDGVPAANMAVYTGMDRRKNVPHDPTGALPRSWHVWGEMAGEE